MSSKTKIVVLRMKEVIYTAIFVGLAILLLILCFIMFRPEKKAVPSASTYIPGKYSASLTLGNEHVNVEVTVDADQILLEDESSIRSFIVINLRRAGYDVIEAETGEEALDKLKENPDTRVALLDIMLPGIDGFEVCRRIRATNTKIGIIMLTARSQEMDKVTGLMTGADDYVTKPFSPAELTARVDALFRRAGGEEIPQTGEIRQDPFLLNTRNRTLEKNGQRVKLTQVEYSIVKLFMENPGKALAREEILDAVWGKDYFGELKIVDVNIRRLRIKIEDNTQKPIYINTVWGYGYKWRG